MRIEIIHDETNIGKTNLDEMADEITTIEGKISLEETMEREDTKDDPIILDETTTLEEMILEENEVIDLDEMITNEEIENLESLENEFQFHSLRNPLTQHLWAMSLSTHPRKTSANSLDQTSKSLRFDSPEIIKEDQRDLDTLSLRIPNLFASYLS